MKGEENSLLVVVSTGAVDRDRDTVDPGGWELSDFAKNPVVTWCHDYSAPPVARSPRIYVENGRLLAQPEFTDRETYPFGHMVGQLMRKGFLNAVSAGFQPVEWTMNEERRGIDFKRQKLMEFAICPVPSNPESLVEARSAGIDIEPYEEWLEQSLARSGGAHALIKKLVADLEKAMMLGKSQIAMPVEKGVAPKDVSMERADEGEVWSGPTLSDFTSESFDSLSDAERRRIAGHFAWAEEMPPSSYGQLKLPHHRASDGKIVLRGVQAAMGVLLGARGGADLPDGDRRAVYNHLVRHYRAFDREPPEFRTLKEISAQRLWEYDSEMTTLEPKGTKYFEKQAFEIQTLIFPKSKWDSAAAAKSWAQDHDFRTDKVDETEDSWRFRQREPGDFERLRTICINPGRDASAEDCRVKAVGGPLKAIEPEVTKRGRVLSQKNENRIRQAMESLQSVLSELGQQPDAEPDDEKQSSTPPPKANGKMPDDEAMRALVRDSIMRVTGKIL